MHKFSLLTGALFLALPAILPAALVVSYDAPNGQFTTVSGTTQYTFDSNPQGQTTNLVWAGVGTFDNIDIVGANQFGGSNGTQYAVNGAPSNILSTTLTFVAPEAYFGFEWLAVDSKNTLTVNFTGGGSQVFNSATLSAALGTCPGGPYCGNPFNRSEDPNENFAYVNFTTTGSTRISSVSFTNADFSTGFEFDSLAVTATQPGVPGNPLGTPEPLSMSLTLSGLAAAGFLGRKRLRKA